MSNVIPFSNSIFTAPVAREATKSPERLLLAGPLSPFALRFPLVLIAPLINQ